MRGTAENLDAMTSKYLPAVVSMDGVMENCAVIQRAERVLLLPTIDAKEVDHQAKRLKDSWAATEKCISDYDKVAGLMGRTKEWAEVRQAVADYKAQNQASVNLSVVRDIKGAGAISFGDGRKAYKKVETLLKEIRADDRKQIAQAVINADKEYASTSRVAYVLMLFSGAVALLAAGLLCISIIQPVNRLNKLALLVAEGDVKGAGRMLDSKEETKGRAA